MNNNIKVFLWILVILCVISAGFGGAVWLHDAFTFTSAENHLRHHLGQDAKTSWPIGAFIFCYAVLGAICIGLMAAIMEAIGTIRRKS